MPPTLNTLNFPRYLLPSFPRWESALLKRHRPTGDVNQPSSDISSSTSHSQEDNPPTRQSRIQSQDSACAIEDGSETEYDEHSYTSDSETDLDSVDQDEAGSSSDSLEIYLDTESGYGGSNDNIVIGSASTSSSSSPPQHHQPSRFNLLRSRKSRSHSKNTSTTAATLPTTASYLHCLACRTHICFTSSVISKGFTGRHGRAYLVTPTTLILANIHHAKPTNRPLQTGAHTVSDISCKVCGNNLGWKYIHAEERSQRYKIGKYILETGRVGKMNYWDGAIDDDITARAFDDEDGKPRKTSRDDDWNLKRIKREGWEVGWEAPDPEDVEDGIEVDLADEEELEEMFNGTWNKDKVLRKRERKRQIEEMRRRVDSNV